MCVWVRFVMKQCMDWFMDLILLLEWERFRDKTMFVLG